MVLSTAEAEYIAACSASCEAIYMASEVVDRSVRSGDGSYHDSM
jgi:hypothetical protein